MSAPKPYSLPTNITEIKNESRSLKKTVFIGSSSGDTGIASKIAEKLTGGNVVGKCWTEEFPLGLLTFEALERMLRTCVGAVFIVSADSNGNFNDNVMIELGLVAGRMGRLRLALCTNGDMHLPSDLAGFTRVTNLFSSSEKKDLSDTALQQLRGWAENLPAVCENIPCTQILHGYAGRWQVVLQFSSWREQKIGDDDIAGMKAELTLCIPHDGLTGFGILTGKVILHRKENEKRKNTYTGLFHICSFVGGVTCQCDGSMSLRTQTFVRQCILEKGKELREDALPEDLAMPWIFHWDMSPVSSNPGLLKIKIKTEMPENWTCGEDCAYKEPMHNLGC